MAPIPGNRCSVRQASWDPLVWIFDFDAAAPGGGGGASICLDPPVGLVSIAGAGSNKKLPKRSTGGLVADGLRQTPMPQPAIVEGYNVETTTWASLAAGGDGQGTLIGNLLADLVQALGGTVVRWEPLPDGAIYHLRVHVVYP